MAHGFLPAASRMQTTRTIPLLADRSCLTRHKCECVIQCSVRMEAYLPKSGKAKREQSVKPHSEMTVPIQFERKGSVTEAGQSKTHLLGLTISPFHDQSGLPYNVQRQMASENQLLASSLRSSSVCRRSSRCRPHFSCDSKDLICLTCRHGC